jgi:hypothetical protein
MQLAKPIVLTIASLTLIATPVLAKNAKAPKADPEETSPTCSAYQADADGNWVPKPCQELGTHSPSEHRPPSKTHEQQER